MNYRKTMIYVLLSFILVPMLMVPVFALEYTVEAGDSLYQLGQRYGITAGDIQRSNGLEGDRIQVGQRLTIPASSRSITGDFTQEEIDLMAKAVYSEARGEIYTGQVAVAAVILNRLKHSEFPNTIKDVIFQPLAFTAVSDGQFWLTPDAQAYKAVRDAINGWDPTNNAVFYWNPSTATSKWIWSRQIHIQIGKHVFAH